VILFTSFSGSLVSRIPGAVHTSIYYMTCLTVFIISVALLMVGLWNATLLLSEKGFYGLAFFLSLFGAVAVQKNIRDAGINPPKETQVTQEEYSE
ncbi:YiaA/YiaB family inner membrane protein, partial [Escherichia coli]